MQNIIDRINLRTMRSVEAVAHYSRPIGLSRHEKAALDVVADQARGKAILDIGVGAGRTVPALLAISSDYLGIDYSQKMVDACRERFPQQRFLNADARGMASIADGSIHLAVFSCNGLCMVGHADRLQIVREAYRVLAPGGSFVFTTYNRNCPEAKAGFRFPDFTPSRNPARALVRAARFARDIAVSAVQRSRHLRHEVHATDFAVLNDRCHNYSVMLYYITLANQRRQLEAAGFEPDAEAFDLHGHRIEGDTPYDSMALVARKARL
jgi:SAM-dependent methyltransferase